MHTYIYDVNQRAFGDYICVTHSGSEFYFPEGTNLFSIAYSIYEEKGREAAFNVLLNYFLHDIDSIDCYQCDSESLALKSDASRSCIICGHRPVSVRFTA
jgi:hypothetical protein